MKKGDDETTENVFITRSLRRCDHRKCANTFDGHRPLRDPAFGQGTVPSRQRCKAITRSQKWKYDAKDVTEKSQKLMDPI